MTISAFSNPVSVIQRSPTCGVFGNNSFVGRPDEFVQKVIGHWYAIPGNTLPCESNKHLDMAEKLYGFYIKYCEKKQQVPDLNYGKILYILYTTGSIEKAENELKLVA